LDRGSSPAIHDARWIFTTRHDRDHCRFNEKAGFKRLFRTLKSGFKTELKFRIQGKS
jgi:hypothetical protein